MFHAVEGVFREIIRYSTIVMEAAGVLVVLIVAANTFAGFLKRKPHLRIQLAEGISLALLFKMGGEVLRTVIVRTWDELAILGAIIVIRAVLTFLLAWEIRSEKASERMEHMEQAERIAPPAE